MRPTIVDLSNRELRASASQPDPVIKWITDRRTYFLSGASSVTELYTDQYVYSRKTLRDLENSETVTWKGATISSPGTAEQRKEIQAAIDAAARQLAVVEDAAHPALTEGRYRRLFDRWFLPLAALFVVAMVLFVATTASKGEAKVTEPVAVHVIVVDREAAGLPSTCTATKLDGVAVAGTLEDPVVALEPAQGCPSGMLGTKDGLVIVPVPSG